MANGTLDYHLRNLKSMLVELKKYQDEQNEKANRNIKIRAIKKKLYAYNASKR